MSVFVCLFTLSHSQSKKRKIIKYISLNIYSIFTHKEVDKMEAQWRNYEKENEMATN